jgi:hypothetical protein
MNEQEQRIAIAEACGWTIRRTGGAIPLHQVFEPSGKPCCPYATAGDSWRGYLPDYLHDLNAMHEAEKMLKENQHGDFEAFIMQVCCPDQGEAEGEFELDSFWPTLHATAAQRAEAFLRTIGKWTD